MTMARRGESDGDSGSEDSDKESEEKFRYPEGKMSEYENQRLSRIAENKARLEALGISKAATALLASSPNPRTRSGKRSSDVEDNDYRPDGDEDNDDGDYDEEDEEFIGDSRKLKNTKRKVLNKKNLDRSDPLGDDDLKKAIALSLTAHSKKRRNDEEAGGSWKKKRPELMSKTQMTGDELVIYFYQFDEAGKGFITLRDVAKMAKVHDFTWKEEELQDMIRCFDMDKDGKLSLEEFTKIVRRCRLLKES